MNKPIPAWILILLAAVLLFMFLGRAPVQRTQEARVLETARQMLDEGPGGPRAWLLPKLNGDMRLKKPPLMYWTTAVAFQIGGVSETIGRIPSIVFALGTLCVTFALARRLFGRRCALLSAGVLLSSYLFYRHGRLAETDIPVAFFVTLAVYAIARAIADDVRHPARWFHLAGAAIALTIMAKGAPAAFPILLIIALGLCRERSWRAFRPAVTGCSLITLAAVALPWFIYILMTVGLGQITSELDVVARGENHFGWPWQYLYQLLSATAPYSPLFVLAVVQLVRQWKLDAGARFVGLWGLSILLPLMVIGNKQFHYLLPMMPACAILIGWLLDRGTRADSTPQERSTAILGIVLTAILVMIGAIAIPLVPRFTHQAAGGTGTLLSVLLLLLAIVAAAAAMRRPGASAFYLVLPLSVAGPLLIAAWLPAATPDDARSLAGDARTQLPPAPLLFGDADSISLPLCFNLRQRIDCVPDAGQLAERLRLTPDTVVIVEIKNDRPAPTMSADLAEVHRFVGNKRTMLFYQKRTR